MERKYVHFDAHRYTRNLVVLDKHFSLLIICWGKKQETYAPAHSLARSLVATRLMPPRWCRPIHDHGKVGIRSWVRVLSGKLCCSYGYEHGDPDKVTTVSMEPSSDVVVFDGTRRAPPGGLRGGMGN